MSRNRRPLVAGICLLALCGNAAAANNNFYILGAFGNTNSDVAAGGINRVDDNGGSFSLGAGFTFSQHFAIEVAYQDFGSQYGETDCPPFYACLVIPVTTQADMTAVSLSVTGGLALSDSLDGYGRVGFARWDLSFDGISAAFDDSGEDLLYGAGLRWTLDDRWKIFAEYARVDLDLDTASLGVNYRF